MSIGSSSDSLAIAIALSAEPPTPRPISPGGHQPAPSPATVPSTQSTTESLGLRTANRALFSEPPPLAATWTSMASPSTTSTCSIAGVLSPVFSRANNGSDTSVARSGLLSVSQARRTASSAIAWSERRDAMRAPIPSFTKIVATPVSWHNGLRPKAAMREFVRICPMASRAAGLSSRSHAALRAPT